LWWVAIWIDGEVGGMEETEEEMKEDETNKRRRKIK
jgi:hypothetical protein